MNPAMMALLPILFSAFEQYGKQGETGSTYNEGQQGGIDDLLKALKGMSGGGNMDITQNPMYQQGNEYLMSMFNDPEFFKNIEAPMQRQFEEQTIPDLANRFASQGSGGALGSTGFRNQLGREGSNLHTNMAAMREQMKMNAIPQMFQSANQPYQNMMQMYNTALGHPTQNTYQPPGGGMWGPIAGAATQGYFQNANNNPGQSPSTNAMAANAQNVVRGANSVMY